MILKREKADVALRKFLSRITHRTEEEVVRVSDSANRVLREDVVSKRTLPPFDRAAMDGYAVRAEDTFGASFSSPVVLRIAGEVEIGKKAEVEVGSGEAVRISTGAMMPPGTNAVVMVEYTEESDGFVEIYRAVAVGENVSRRGEDVREGEVIMKKGEVIQSFDTGLLLSAGINKVRVGCRVKVAVAATGDELKDVLHESSSDGDDVRIPDANRPAVISMLKDLGAEVVDLGIVGDSREEMRDVLEESLKYDAAIFTGATSAGKKDVMPEVVEEAGEIVVHGVAIKPGMPTALGIVEGKPVFLLPGFPVACIVAFRLFVPPALMKVQGSNVLAFPGETVRARLTRRIPSGSGTRTFTRVRLSMKGVEKGEILAEPVRTSGSGILSSIVRAHGIVEVEEELEGLEAGEIVDVRLIRHLVV